MLFLLFLCGFAAATLVFWPLLNRANKRAAESSSPQRGRHALAAASAPAKPAARKTATAVPAAKPEGEPVGEGSEGGAAGADSTQPVAVDSAPPPREPEEDPMPELPTDLFENHYQAKFNRPKRRLERIRAEISQSG